VMSSSPELLERIIASAITLYMLLVLLRWSAPALEVELETGRRKWIGRITDPPIELARRAIGQTMGPFDWAPIAVLLALWILRILLAGF